MKIYFLTYAYESGITADLGGFRKLWELADRLQKQGHQAKLFFPALPGFRSLKVIPSCRYPVINFPLLRPVTAYLAMFLCALFQGWKEKPQIIYFRSSPNILASVLSRCLHTKLILEVNVIFREFYKNLRIPSLRHYTFLMAERFNATHSNKIISLTPGLKKFLTEEYKISENKISVIPSATDTEHFYPRNSGESKKEIGILSDSMVIGFAGIFYPHQGVNTLINAAKYILNIYPKTIFLIVGNGMMYSHWRNLARSEGVKKHFIFTGQIEYEKMPIYFNAMDIVTAPFTYGRGEASPFKIFDALACAKVVVASDIPSIRLLAEEFNGSIVTVHPDDPVFLAKAINGLLSTSEKRDELGKNARKLILEKYSWDTVVKQIENVLEF